MKIHRTLSLLFFSSAALWAQGTSVIVGAPPPRPNIIFIMADDYGIDNVGAYGSDLFAETTPNIDRLASEGMMFTDAYCHPKCGPSRAAYYTGQYPFRNGTMGKSEIAGVKSIHDQRPNLVAMLNSTGYTTGTFGKAETDYFDEVLNTGNGQDYYSTEIFYRLDGVETPLTYDAPTFGPTVYMEYVLDFLERNHGQPFYLDVELNMPHVPWQASPDFLREKNFPWIHPTEDRLDLDGYIAANPTKGLDDLLQETEGLGQTFDKGEIYADMNEHIDDYVGQILAKVHDLGIAENTLIIFTGDNGSLVPGTKPKVWDPASESYRRLDGAKDQYGDAGGLVPFIVRWPAYIAPGQKPSHLVDFTDLLPTYASLAGVQPPAGHIFDGHDLSPFLMGSPTFQSREYTFVQRGPIYWIRNEGYRMDHDGTFYDYSDAPFSMAELNPASLTPEEQTAYERLDYLLNEKLDPMNGICYEAASDYWMNLPYWDWKRSHWQPYHVVGITAISGDHADPDDDGWPNLFEMAYGTDPNDSADAPTLSAANVASHALGEDISPNTDVRIERVSSSGDAVWGTVFKTFSGSGDPVLKATRTDLTNATNKPTVNGKNDPIK